jgi:hypothetical protein
MPSIIQQPPEQVHQRFLPSNAPKASEQDVVNASAVPEQGRSGNALKVPEQVGGLYGG